MTKSLRGNQILSKPKAQSSEPKNTKTCGIIYKLAFTQIPCYFALMQRLAFILAVTLAQFSMPVNGIAQQLSANQSTKPECFCTDRYGKRRELGDIICLTVGDRSYEAKCIMVLNNPYWRDLERGCLSASVTPENEMKMTPRPAQLPTLLAALYQ